MALNFNPDHFRQNSALGLASSHCYLDGVPFKISPTFKPPPPPVIPEDVLNPRPVCYALTEEYEYDTEEAVLAWARAREEAKAKAIAEREAAERARAALAAAESNTDSDSDDDAPDTIQQQAASRPVAAGRAGQPAQQPQPVKPPWQLPVGGQGGNTILTPTQAAQAKVATPKTPKAQVDLALFEQEGDPFDNLELQTINDMEELRTLLGGTSVSASGNTGGTNVGGASNGPSPNPETCLEGGEAGDVENMYSNIGVSAAALGNASQNMAASSDLYENLVPGPSGMMFADSRKQAVSVASSVGSVSSVASSANTANRASGGFVIEPTGDGDYVQIRSDFLQQSVSFQRDSAAPIYSNMGAGAESCGGGGSPPEQYANSKMIKPVLPPIRPRGQSLGSDQLSEATAPLTTNTAEMNGVVAAGGGRMTQSAYFPPASAAGSAEVSASNCTSSANQNHTYSNMGGGSYAINLYSRYGNLGSGSPSPRPASVGDKNNSAVMRSSKSNPDLSATTQVPPWNPYKPLPPTPISEHRSSSSSSESLPNDHTAGPSASAGRAADGEDPYNSLSSEAKTFVNNLTAMGFSRSRAARAVQKFGADEREVLDHLLNVDKLVEKKFPPPLAETGLQLFRNDIHKAEQFLDLYQQFTELGFTGDRIQTALVKHQLDRDKALDYLTT